jgi:hypothetical protein
MKSIKYIALFLFALGIWSSCTKDEIDVKGLTDFPPSILQVKPEKIQKVGQVFDIYVEFADGTNSPLSNATVRLLDANDTELANTSKGLSGARDSVVIPGIDFASETLALGLYKVDISVTDSKGQTTTKIHEFEVSLQEFNFVLEAVYLAGSYNGWGATPFELIDNNTWIAYDQEFDGGEWKIKDDPDWGKDDWSDPECDGFLALSTGGGPNSACSPNGKFHFKLNDKTLTYEFVPAVLFNQNIESLYLHASFNDFQGMDYPFSIVDDNTWVLNEVLLKPGDKIRFSEGPFGMGLLFGDDDLDGKADEFGANIEISSSMSEAFYNIHFNDRTRVYEFEFVRFPSIGIIGSATPGGWDFDTDLNDNGDGTFGLLLTLVDGEAKFRANDDWGTNWGSDTWPCGTATQGGPNIPVTAGTYEVTFNPSTGEYCFEENLEIGLIGSATPGGWDNDTDLTNNGDGSFTLIVGLADGEAKFRANNAWDINWGSGDFPSGTGEQNGANIPVTKGVYKITFNPGTGDYNFEALSIGIIGSATPGGWDNDTDMTQDADDATIVTVNLTFVDGEAKFRANDGWDINWGSDTYPTGTATMGGPNIPVPAGTYDVKLKVHTGEYSFE